MNNEFKVKIVAIAKDEGAYIAEWIFHHLYFGFDAIDVYVNRTTDNTCDILDVISKMYPNVNYAYVDWIEMHMGNVAKRMQHIIYSQAYSEERKNKNFTHILFIDIDEFWTPLNFQDSIHDCLSSLSEHTCVSFQWFNVLGEENEFQYMSKSIKGYYQSLVKSICRTNAEIDEMMLHLPKFYKNKKFQGYLLSDGDPFMHSENSHQELDSSLERIVRPCIIVHRMYRSEIEYISLLYRGNPENHEALKLNRQHGFLRTHEYQDTIEFKDELYLKYLEQRESFFQKIQIDNKLINSKNFVLKRAGLTFDALPREFLGHYKEVNRVVKGLKNPEVIRICKNAEKTKETLYKRKSKFKNFDINNFKNTKCSVSLIALLFEDIDDKMTANKIKKNNDQICKYIKNFNTTVDVLREMALYFEKKDDIDQALVIMQEAFSLRRNGPKIQEKLKLYKKIIQKRKKNT